MSVLIPCYNESSILETTIEGLQQIQYDNFEIIFINDESTDQTLEKLHQMLNLQPLDVKTNQRLSYAEVKGYYVSLTYPNMYVIDKINGGKADSLNAAIDYARFETIITLDADTILDRQALHRVNEKFTSNVVAAGGYVRILQGAALRPRKRYSFKLKPIIQLQTLEYIKGFGILKESLAKMNALMVISGAFGIFKKDVLFEVGGYRKTIGEDIDITLKIQAYLEEHSDKKMIFISEAVCYTECPENWKDLYKQRIRWQKAFVDCVIRYRTMLLKTMFTRPVSIFMVFDSLIGGTVASYISFFALAFIIFNPLQDISTFMLVTIGYSMVVNLTWNLTALMKNREMNVYYSFKDIPNIAKTIMLDLIIFRYIGSFFVLMGTIMYFFNKEDWNKVARTGTQYQIANPTKKISA